ncbi:hypothetical protein RYX36_020812 [Vicia faba]
MAGCMHPFAERGRDNNKLAVKVNVVILHTTTFHFHFPNKNSILLFLLISSSYHFFLKTKTKTEKKKKENGNERHPESELTAEEDNSRWPADKPHNGAAARKFISRIFYIKRFKFLFSFRISTQNF